MKLHVFIISYDGDSGLMLFNPINDALVFMPDTTGPLDVQALSEQNIKKLFDMLFLTDLEDSSRLVAGIYKQIKYSERKISLIIHTNYSCNLNCTYCYQEGSVSRNDVMTQEIIDEFYPFFNKIKEHNSLEIVDLCFIGGEPLLHSNIVEEIFGIACKVFSGIQITKTLVTNGTRILSSIECLKSINFDCIQITLDGTESVHNKYRVSHKKSDSYFGILSNLKQLEQLGNFNVEININLMENNAGALEELLLDLKRNDIIYPIIFSIVFSGMNNSCNDLVISMKKKADVWFNSHVLAAKYGYSFLPLYRQTRFSCGRFKENSLCISPKGEIFKCISGMEAKQYYISSIKEFGTVKYYNRLAHLIEAPKICRKAQDFTCPYSLICDGGCSFITDTNGWNCQKSFLHNGPIKFLYWQTVNNSKLLNYE